MAQTMHRPERIRQTRSRLEKGVIPVLLLAAPGRQRRHGARRYSSVIAIGLVSFWLTACGPGATPTYFVPPTLNPAPAAPLEGPSAAPGSAGSSSESRAAPTVAAPTATPACSDDLGYLQDLTIPDGSAMAAGQLIDKRWEVRNSGSCNWDERYRLRLISGDPMGAEQEVPLYPARAGSDATLQILFTAPQAPGRYQCQWQAINPDGTPFGDAFYMEIIVGG